MSRDRVRTFGRCDRGDPPIRSPPVLINALRSFWAEPRQPDPPRRVWRDWLLVGALIAAAGLEGLTRPDLVWRPLAIVAQIALITISLMTKLHARISVRPFDFSFCRTA